MRAVAALAAILALGGAAGATQIGADALDTLPSADIVVLGEIHDHPLHHLHQARAVAALRPSAVVFEMLTPQQAARVTPDLLSDPAALGKALEWDASGWPDFAIYAPIFDAASGARIVGAALPRSEVRRAVSEGAVAVFGPDAALWGLSEPLAPDVQAAREAAQAEAHCNALPEALLPGMVAAQRLRDAAFARAAAKAHADTGGPVVVITGTGHAHTDEGVPAALAAGAPHLTVLSVGQLESDPGPDAPFDLWIVTDPHPRPDPCAAFR